MPVLKKIYSTTKGDYHYSLMGSDDKPTHLHIDNFRTKNNSVLVPVDVLVELLPINEIWKEIAKNG